MNPAAPVWLPLGFHEWMPAAQAATLGLLTFVQEDLPTVSAALLAAAGTLSWSTGFLGVFLGIWMGDALLYLLARGMGRPLLPRAWCRRFFDPAAVADAEQWFSRRGTWLLLSSRFVPGTRLPTYLAAGILRLPFQRFLAVTGIAVAIWTASIFLVARAAGPELLQWLKRFNSGTWALLAVAIVVVVGLRFATQLATSDRRRRIVTAMIRWTRWEFWPAWLFYFPVALNFLRLALRYRGFMLPTAANPGMFSGGFVGESKIATLRDLARTSPEFTAEAVLLPVSTDDARPSQLESIRVRHAIDYPFILKPDVGQRGVGVKLIRTEAQAEDYLRHTKAPLVIQRYAPGPREIGVFYYRFPHERHGRIFAITEKLFPFVTGDGKQTVEELIWQDRRARLIAGKYLQRIGRRRSDILPPGERLKLVEAGNHAQGCIFQDGMHLWSEELESRIDDISQRLDGFFVGRYDIRYDAEEDLRAGRGFQIIELNGAASEATSIYDARNSIVAAYRTLFRQWELVFAIGAANRARGCAPTNPGLLWRKWRETNALIASYPLAD